MKYVALILALLCLSPLVEGKVIHVNETGWWVDTSQFHQSNTPLDDALKNASDGDKIIVYANGKLSGVIFQGEDRVLIKSWFWVFLGVLLFVASAFGLILYAGYRSNRNLNKAEMRRAVAGAFVIGVHCLLVLSVVFDVARDIVIGAYIGGITSIIGFYFGSRTVHQIRQEDEGYMGIENVDFRKEDKRGQIVVTFRNGSGKSVDIDAVYVNKRRVEISKIRVNPFSPAEIPVNFEWKEGEEYEIKVCTSEGRCSQIRVKAPERGGEM